MVSVLTGLKPVFAQTELKLIETETNCIKTDSVCVKAESVLIKARFEFVSEKPENTYKLEASVNTITVPPLMLSSIHILPFMLSTIFLQIAKPIPVPDISLLEANR